MFAGGALLLQAAVEEFDKGSLKDQPLVEARVRSAISTTLVGLCCYDDAESQVRKALAIRRGSLPAGHASIVTSMNNLAEVMRIQNS